jgi:hypothetical protein
MCGKDVMAIEIAKFGGLNNLFLVILSELTIKCEIRFDKFCENLWRTNGNARERPLFSTFS